MSSKPLPLKQRTSSIDTRRDYSTQTWTSVLGLIKLRELLITVDHFSIWRRHLAWAIADGKDLRDYMTQRYASSMVFMSLLLGMELNVLFNSAGVTTHMRQALMHEEIGEVSFWAGIIIMISAVLTLLSLISIYTAWTMVSAVSVTNAHCIFRSSIGQYVAELPGRFIVGSIYTFLVWLSLFFFLLLPFGFWSLFLLAIVLALFVHTITAFSAFGRVIMHTSAMGSNPIFDAEYEASLLPHTLHADLLVKARANLANKTSIKRQYHSSAKPIHRHFTEDELSARMSAQRATKRPAGPTRKRTASLVKFADGFDTNGDPLVVPPPSRPGLVYDAAASSPPLSHVMRATKASPLSELSSTPPRPRRPPRPQAGRVEHVEAPEPVENEPDSLFAKWLTNSTTSSPPIATPVSPRSPARSPAESDDSSLEGMNMMTDEEKFDLEYGEDFQDELRTSSTPEDDAPEEDQVETEFQRLLSSQAQESKSPPSYSSFKGDPF